MGQLFFMILDILSWLTDNWKALQNDFLNYKQKIDVIYQ